MRTTLTLLSATLVLLALPVPTASAVGDAPWLDPLGLSVQDRGFDRNASEWGPGHRGLDLAGQAGAPVRAVAAGRVTWAGQVAGRNTVTVDHGRERSTYEPLDIVVRVGQQVEAGQLLGNLVEGHGSCPQACLHLGRLKQDRYLDPAELLRPSGFRLISPDGPPPSPPHGAAGVLPLAGVVTSPFGQRIHPITGQAKLHDGVDVAAPCGTAVPAVGPGTVTRAGMRGAYGIQVEVDHGNREATSYSHLARVDVRVGQRLAAGEVVGTVGTTGMSTGCHLHFMRLTNGVARDPLR